VLDNFLKEVIKGPRSDAIWKKAGEKLCLFANLPCPDPYDHQMVLQRFIPNMQRPVAAPATLPQIQPQTMDRPIKTHIVQSGENLWKIARKYRVSIDVLRKANHLESDKLLPGKKLVIP
jgi:hypothetical protein